jgi:hypothetical protein
MFYPDTDERRMMEQWDSREAPWHADGDTPDPDMPDYCPTKAQDEAYEEYCARMADIGRAPEYEPDDSDDTAAFESLCERWFPRHAEAPF